MSNTPHELADDFPEHAARIAELKQKDAHFDRMVTAYHDINRDVHRAETDVEPVSDEHMTSMRRRRMQLKDEIFAVLNK
ncbi:YdcH family protein [uncultured Tateyamaria sp.]|uniref:YdcH family protein n=1 Tax=uncultured Tateyamaria sp. TaxID=455651 RepID=UPI00261CD708|nr:DUF465 domain-containing protein [uncultured Tateyamaria sp.]